MMIVFSFVFLLFIPFLFVTGCIKNEPFFFDFCFFQKQYRIKFSKLLYIFIWMIFGKMNYSPIKNLYHSCGWLCIFVVWTSISRKILQKSSWIFLMILYLLFSFDKGFSFHLSRCKFYFYTNNTAKRILCRTHLFTFIDHYILDVRFIWPVERL